MLSCEHGPKSLNEYFQQLVEFILWRILKATGIQPNEVAGEGIYKFCPYLFVIHLKYYRNTVWLSFLGISVFFGVCFFFKKLLLIYFFLFMLSCIEFVSDILSHWLFFKINFLSREICYYSSCSLCALFKSSLWSWFKLLIFSGFLKKKPHYLFFV